MNRQGPGWRARSCPWRARSVGKARGLTVTHGANAKAMTCTSTGPARRSRSLPSRDSDCCQYQRRAWGRRPSPGAEVSALHGTRQGFQDPLAAPLHTHRHLACMELLHGQSILEVLRTRPLTGPAPGSDRRLSGEAHHVGRHSHRSDHEPHGSVPAVQRRRPGARPGMHLRRERPHLHTGGLHRMPRHRKHDRRAPPPAGRKSVGITGPSTPPVSERHRI